MRAHRIHPYRIIYVCVHKQNGELTLSAACILDWIQAWIQASLDEKSQSQSYVNTGSASQKARREMEERRSIGRDQGQQQHGNGRAVPIADGDVIEMEAAAASTVPSSSRQQGDDGAGGVQGPRWKRFLAYVGPGFLISMAYLDPSNLQTDLQAGYSHRYELLWVLLFGFIFVLIIQSLAAKLGIVTGRHLAELCMSEYPKHVRYALWFFAELGVIAATIPGVLGTALAYNMVLDLPFWAGLLICAATIILLLGLQSYGVRKVEFMIAVFMLIMASCFFIELSHVNPPMNELIEGLFIPRLNGHYAISDAVALISALVVPHNLFLHSSLVSSRKLPSSSEAVKDASMFFLLENAFALFLALVINVAIVSLSGTVCADNLSLDDTNTCSTLTLKSASILFKNVLGRPRSFVYGLALLASGQSCAVVTTYSGQYIMQGFSGMRVCIIYLFAPCLTMVPTLIICGIGGALRVRQLINIAAIILSFVLPFALVPLLKFSSCCSMIGPYKNSTCITRVSWILSVVIIGINTYFFCTTFVSWLVYSDLPSFL
ncbi:metal transporter Nramp4-like isoform X3 [Hordeum vulgare subsp. vulgare]|uniref:metal transporter Nramp4-like isoform X3 n=1 Tax=Hordeum vulgare subsp. vulgare TaxID=112509 RepID=UPI000B464C9B|nr:metal transporter Nramp4-like isoform X3 [Hordeum vulgare subsp. vulgare]